MIYKFYASLFLLSIFYGCGNGEEATLLDRNSTNSLTISGAVQYERITPSHSGSETQLNNSNIIINSSKGIVVQVLDASNKVVATGTTDNQGKYSFSKLPTNTSLKIRAFAKLFKSSNWSVKVIDNTNANALYVLEGALVNSGEKNSSRDLLAKAKNRDSAPFAILDSIYLALTKVYAIDNKVSFPELFVNWSVNNLPSSGSLSAGQIGTSFFDGHNNIYILGDENSDTDEFDTHVVIHEWGHFFENKLSRADNIGGSHGTGEHLDIRIAFGEGFGNALSAIITDNPIYFDTFGRSGWNMNIESASHDTPGWFSEASIQRILYDLYDDHNDGADHLSLGLKPLYNILIGKQKSTKAFTSIFSFISELKNENGADANKIDDIVSSEDISVINDIYGTNREVSLKGEVLPLYHELDVGESLNLCTSNNYGRYNKVNNHKYVYFSIPSSDSYTIQLVKLSGFRSDPDFTLFNTSTFENSIISESAGNENQTLRLSKGDYLLDIYDSSYSSKSCFNISLN